MKLKTGLKLLAVALVAAGVSSSCSGTSEPVSQVPVGTYIEPGK